MPEQPIRNAWEFDGNLLVLAGEQAFRGYEIELDACTNFIQAWDWVSHVAMKTWADDKIIADLVRCLCLHLTQRATKKGRKSVAGEAATP